LLALPFQGMAIDISECSQGVSLNVSLANDELKGPRDLGYRRMLKVSAAGRAGMRL
jgi:hypothetical protein